VSRLFPEKLRVVLTPGGVLAGGRSHRARPGHRHRRAVAGRGGGAREPGVDQALPRDGRAFSNHFVRYVVLPGAMACRPRRRRRRTCATTSRKSTASAPKAGACAPPRRRAAPCASRAPSTPPWSKP
jgi:hypothetical protein